MPAGTEVAKPSSSQDFVCEEVEFEHDNVQYVYLFLEPREDDSNPSSCSTGPATNTHKRYQFRRKRPLCTIGEQQLLPGGKNIARHTAIVVLFKASEGGIGMVGFLPKVLKMILEKSNGREGMMNQLRLAIEGFQTVNPIASVEEVMKFVEPYAPWKVSSPLSISN
jgi:hypothetical protein